MANQNAVQDDNQWPALIAHTGTAGTAETVKVVADSSGNLGVNIVTGEIVASLGTVKVVEDGTVVVKTLNTVGTVGVLNAGSIVVTAGTIGDLDTVGTIGVINAGSIVVTNGTVTTTMGDLSGGTIDVLTTGSIVVTAGTISDLNTIGTIGVINDGTVTVGNINSVGTVGVVNGGSVVVTNGTIGDLDTVGTVGVLNAGSVVVTAGTIGDLDTVGTVGVLNGGSIAVTALPDLPGGTIDSITNVAGGTVQVNPKSPTSISIASALGTTAGTTFGTLSAASGAGTSHYVAGLQVVVHAGTTDCYVGFGTATTGGSVLARGVFVPGGGIARDFSYPITSGTNSEICWNISGAGTAYFAVNYWKE